jgi:hypothetical protein
LQQRRRANQLTWAKNQSQWRRQSTAAGAGCGAGFFFFGIAFGHPLLVTRSGSACLLLGFFRHVQTTSQHDTAFSEKHHPEIAPHIAVQIPCSPVQIPCSFAKIPCSAE